MTAEDSPFEPGSPEDFAWVSANVGNVEALQRQINAAEDRILARQALEELKTRLGLEENAAIARHVDRAARKHAPRPLY